MRAEARSGPIARRRPALASVKRWLGRAFLLLVLLLLARLALQVDWAEAWQALRALPARALWAAAGLCVLSHLFYSCYDLVGRHQTRHGLPVARTAAVSFMSYAFNLNLGALVGGVAFRFRLYSRLGLGPATITQVLLLSLLTNWLGYFVLAGTTLLLWAPELPASWGLAQSVLPVLGAALLLAAGSYVLACFVAKGRPWHWRGHELRPPSGRVALLQLLLATSSWAVIAAICWVLLQQRVAYPLVLGALLTAAVAGVITHVPAGLGVLEAVFVLLLSRHIAQGELLGALLAYRALYYLLPLLVASSLLLALGVAKKKGRPKPPL